MLLLSIFMLNILYTKSTILQTIRLWYIKLVNTFIFNHNIIMINININIFFILFIRM